MKEDRNNPDQFHYFLIEDPTLFFGEGHIPPRRCQIYDFCGKIVSEDEYHYQVLVFCPVQRDESGISSRYLGFTIPKGSVRLVVPLSIPYELKESWLERLNPEVKELC